MASAVVSLRLPGVPFWELKHHLQLKNQSSASRRSYNRSPYYHVKLKYLCCNVGHFGLFLACFLIFNLKLWAITIEVRRRRRWRRRKIYLWAR